jgi:hypothetical protein
MEQLLQGSLTLFLRSWKFFNSRRKNFLGVWQEEEGGEVVEFMCNI